MENKLPKNWVVLPLELLGEDKYYSIGDGDHGQIKPSNYQDFGVPYIRVGDLDWGFFKENKLVYISEEVHNKNLKSELLPGDILIAKTGATIGKCCIVPQHIKKANTTSSVGKVSINKKLTSSKWILYYFLSPDFFKLMWSHSHRTAQPGFNIIDLKKFPTPLPPLTEQNRIVAKLDALFAQHEAIKISMVKIPELLKNFRQQVLTQAVTGKLTEEWRKGMELEELEIELDINNDYKLDDIPVEWKHGVIKNIAKVKGGKRLPKGEELVNHNTGYPYIRARDLKKGTVLVENLMFLEQETQIQIKNYIVNEGDLYITIVGAKIGDAGIIPKKMHLANLTENVAKITDLNKSIFNKFLSLWLRSSICQTNIQQTIMSAAQGKLALTRINQLPVYLPPLKEQQEIVKRVESLFAKADSIEQQYQNLKAKIDTLPQAILHKAFKGELTKQLDSDGDARELLREIEMLREEITKVSKKKKVKV